MSNLRKKLDEALTSYIKKFEKKHGIEMEFAVSDDLMGIICFGCIYYFSINDIVEDIDNNYPKRLILDWISDSTDYHIRSGDYNRNINLSSYVKGLRFSDITDDNV